MDDNELEIRVSMPAKMTEQLLRLAKAVKELNEDDCPTRVANPITESSCRDLETDQKNWCSVCKAIQTFEENPLNGIDIP